MSFINDEQGATAIEYGFLSSFGFILISVIYVMAVDPITTAMSILTATLTV